MSANDIKESIGSYHKFLSGIFDTHQDESWMSFSKTLRALYIKSLESDEMNFSLDDFLFLTEGVNKAAQSLTNEEPLDLKSKFGRMALCLALIEYLVNLPDDKFKSEAQKYAAWGDLTVLNMHAHVDKNRPELWSQYLEISLSQNRDTNQEIAAIKKSLVSVNQLELPRIFGSLGHLNREEAFIINPLFHGKLQGYSTKLKDFSDSVELYLKENSFFALNSHYNREKEIILLQKKYLSEVKTFVTEKLPALNNSFSNQPFCDVLEKNGFSPSVLLPKEFILLDNGRLGHKFGREITDSEELMVSFIERLEGNADDRLNKLETSRMKLIDFLERPEPVASHQFRP